MHPHSIIRSLQSSWPALIVTLTFVLGFMLDVSLAIKCYECDEFPGGAAANKKCPGGRLITYGSKFDVSTKELHC